MLSLTGWVFALFYSWYPLDHKNSEKWRVSVRHGMIFVMDYGDAKPKGFRGRLVARLERGSVYKGDLY